MLTLWRRLGRRWPTRIDLRIDPISPRRRRVSAGLHATDTLYHAYIDFLTYSDNHPSRQSGLCPSRERSRTSTKDINGLYRLFPAVSQWLSSSKGYTMQFQWLCITLWRRLGRRWPTRIDLRIDPISPRRRRVSAGLHATDTLYHAYIDFLTYSDNHPSRQSGLCPSRERSRTSTKDINGLYRLFPAVSQWLSSSKGYEVHKFTYRRYYTIGVYWAMSIHMKYWWTFVHRGHPQSTSGSRGGEGLKVCDGWGGVKIMWHHTFTRSSYFLVINFLSNII